MTYTLEDIKKDIMILSAKEFYIKHLLRSDNWYFETKLGNNKEDSMRQIDDFKSVVSQELEISFNNIAIVGSSKIGCSLTPPSAQENKLFKCFHDGSDIDIAIVSEKLFQKYWDLFRHSYSKVNKFHYQFISRGIYRGYINGKYLSIIDKCREEWNNKVENSNKMLRNELYIKHEITYRLYRNWEDFEEYHIQSINEIKEGKM